MSTTTVPSNPGPPGNSLSLSPTPTPTPTLTPWLSAYVAFSCHWSPRACDGFHTACALWILSTIAARRIVLPLGKPHYTPLYLALVARSSLYAKSTTAAIALDTLAAAGLDWLLAPDDASPRSFIHELALKTHAGDDASATASTPSPAEQQRLHNRSVFAAQRGWFYDEFGQQLASIGRGRGGLADFRTLLRRLDDCKERFEYVTFGRAPDVLIRPYLALLVIMTPADMQRSSRRAGSLWHDGFWARFAFVTPPDGDPAPDHAPFPPGAYQIPPELTAPLIAWHARLGQPGLSLSARSAPPGARTPDPLNPLPESVGRPPLPCTLAPGVQEAFNAYHDDLLEIAQENNLPDLDSSYARLAEKALRVAMLLASLENGDHIELAHWSLGYAIAEQWRANLHTLYDHISAPVQMQQPRPEVKLEDRVVAVISRHPHASAAAVARYIRGLSPAEAAEILTSLVFAGRLSASVTSRTLVYDINQVGL